MAEQALVYIRALGAVAGTPTAATILQYTVKMLEQDATLRAALEEFVHCKLGTVETFVKYLILMQHKVMQKDFMDTVLMASLDVDAAWQFHMSHVASYILMCDRMAPGRVLTRFPLRTFDEARYANTRMLFFLVYRNADLCLDTRSAEPYYLQQTMPKPRPKAATDRKRRTIRILRDKKMVSYPCNASVKMSDVYCYAEERFGLKGVPFSLVRKFAVVHRNNTFVFPDTRSFVTLYIHVNRV